MKAALAAMAAVAMAGCATTAPPLAGGQYVAMGSSIVSGPGLGEIKADAPARCMRSQHNYPSLLAERLGMTLIDRTCAGARSIHLVTGWNELPAQADALGPDTRLVTVTVGGNDINYTGNLIAAGCEAGEPLGSGAGFRCPARRLPDFDDYATLEAGLTAIARTVRERAPNARLVFVEYPRMVGETPCPEALRDPQFFAAIAEIGDRLAATTRAVAAAEGAEVLRFHDISVDHAPCSAEPWALGNEGSFAGEDGAPWHTTRAGMAAVAAALADLLAE